MDELVSMDPDAFALAAVRQYLHEQGLDAALAALDASPAAATGARLKTPSSLMGLVYGALERHVLELRGENADARAGESSSGAMADPTKNSPSSSPLAPPGPGTVLAPPPSASDAAARRRRVEDALLRSSLGASLHAAPAAAAEAVHAANLTALAAWPGGRRVAVGAADGTVVCLAYPEAGPRAGPPTALFRTRLLAGGVLALSVCPANPRLLAVGFMDGTVAILDADDGGRVLGARRAHAKYVVALAWVGAWGLVSGAWDQKAALSCLAEKAGGETRGEDALGEGAPFALRPGFQASFGGRVEDVLCTRVDSIPGQNDSAGCVYEIAVAVRGSAHLYLLAFSDLSAPLAGAGLAPPAQPRISHLSTRLLSVNEAHDDRASFTIARLGLFDPGNLSNAVGPRVEPRLASPPALPGPLWVLATDAGSVILFDPETSAHVRTLSGLALGPFHAHALGVFDREALAVAAGQGGTLHAWRVASGEALPPLRAHSPAAVRALCVDRDSSTLFTVSFDRSLKVFCVDAREGPDAA